MSKQFFDFDANTAHASEESSQQPLSVSDLNKRVRSCLETQFNLIWVQAEISNFKAHSSGHWYFSLKDAKAQVPAVMFRGHNSRLKFRPENGMEVLVRGRITVYEPRGNYQVFCETIEPVGAGALQKQFEQLKAKLKSEGLFDASQKRALPKLPKRIAVVTSQTGAAIQDILNVLERRFAGLEVLVVPTIVQGAAAAPKITQALKMAYRIKGVDTIIVGRGGGSMEDLWCFNDETLARTIAKSPVPIISAVGHEIDFTIADFAADLRAPTPSAAAEVVSANAQELIDKISGLEQRLVKLVEQRIHDLWQHVDSLKRLLDDPQKSIGDAQARLASLQARLRNGIFRHVELLRGRIDVKVSKVESPRRRLMVFRQSLEGKEQRLLQGQKQRLNHYRQYLNEKMAVLDAMSPLRVVERGYAIAQKDKAVIKSADQVEIDDLIQVRLAKGSLQARVTERTMEKEKT